MNKFEISIPIKHEFCLEFSMEAIARKSIEMFSGRHNAHYLSTTIGCPKYTVLQPLNKYDLPLKTCDNKNFSRCSIYFSFSLKMPLYIRINDEITSRIFQFELS